MDVQHQTLKLTKRSCSAKSKTDVKNYWEDDKVVYSSYNVCELRMLDVPGSNILQQLFPARPTYRFGNKLSDMLTESIFDLLSNVQQLQITRAVIVSN